MESRSILGKDVQKGDIIERRIGVKFKVIVIGPSGIDNYKNFTILREGEPPSSCIVVKSHIHEMHNVTRENW